jgi:hypothetical protein
MGGVLGLKFVLRCHRKQSKRSTKPCALQRVDSRQIKKPELLRFKKTV